MSAQTFIRRALVFKQHHPIVRNTFPLLRLFSTEIPHVQENAFTKIELETKAKILETRGKDMPTYIEANPFEKEKPQCILCRMDITPNYKNVRLLSQFVSPFTGRIYGRHITGLCTKKQELLEQEITKARSSGFMPTMFKEVSFLKDPKLYNPDKPIRSHRF